MGQSYQYRTLTVHTAHRTLTPVRKVFETLAFHNLYTAVK